LLQDPRFETNAARIDNREALTAQMQERLRTKPVYWWVHLLNRAGVPASRIMRFDELRYHPQVTENRFLPQIPTKHWGTIYAGGAPFHLTGTPEVMTEPPYPGDHDAEVRAQVAAELQTGARANGHAQHNGNNSASAVRPLDGYLVVDCSQGLAGPHASMLMADAGARVIKVEPREGDYLRRHGPPFIGEDAAAFVALNHGKRGIALDPESGEDARLLRSLLGRADVIIEDWHSDWSRRLGLDHESLRQQNPSAVVLSVTGWGENGPWAERPQSDLTAQFAAEVTTSLGRPGEAPLRVGTPIASAYSGIFGFQAVLAALLHRDRGGEGQQIFVSLFGSLLFMRGTLWTAHSNPDGWYGFHLESYLTPPNLAYARSFVCKDGRIMFQPRLEDESKLNALLEKLGVEPGSVQAPAAAIGANPASMPAEVRAFWQSILAEREVIPVCLALDEARAGSGIPLFDYDMLFRSPQAEATQLAAEIDDPHRGRYRVVAPPWTFGVPEKPRLAPAPLLDEHRGQIAAELSESVGGVVSG
jgi:crotonobetainyl-CoA:carnitine CoA-transferase CaiB-like acyl-CoA transferase